MLVSIVCWFILLMFYLSLFDLKGMIPVATYPLAGGRARLKGASSKNEKRVRVTTNVYSRKPLEKLKRRRSADFENKGSGVVYVRGRY